MGEQDLDKLQKEMMERVLNEDKNLVRCKCGNAIEVLQGQVYYDIKKEDGKSMTKTAAKHMS